MLHNGETDRLHSSVQVSFCTGQDNRMTLLMQPTNEVSLFDHDLPSKMNPDSFFFMCFFFLSQVS